MGFRITLPIAAWLGLTLLAESAIAETSTIGRTWAISEPDALTEIETRAARSPSMPHAVGPRSQWTAMHAASLGVTAINRIRSIVPFYTLDQDIRLADGRLLYPKGFTFNPLRYVRLAERLFVVAPADLSWALGASGPGDYILLTGGDPVALGEKTGRPLFLLEPTVKDRLGLTVAPVIVRQVGQKLELSEIRPAFHQGRES